MNESNTDFLFLMQNELSFAVRSVKTALDNDGFNTDKCDITMRYLSEVKEPAPIIIVEADQLLEQNASRVYLCDLCIEKDAKLVLIGWDEELNRMKTLTAPGIIAATFTRPINAKEITDMLRELLADIKKRGLRKKILVVDDSPTFLRTASEWLENDYNVNICPSATAAFHIIETNRPDLILLDYEMPVCSGAQFLEMLHSEVSTEDIPVIFLTSRDDPATVKEVVSLKPQGYLLKTQPKEKILQNIKDFFVKEKAY